MIFSNSNKQITQMKKLKLLHIPKHIGHWTSFRISDSFTLINLEKGKKQKKTKKQLLLCYAIRHRSHWPCQDTKVSTQAKVQIICKER